MRQDRLFDGAVHVNTGTGVMEDGVFLTTEFARQTCRSWGVEMTELHPPKSYEQCFIEEPVCDGLPGPGLHRIAYARLKERAIRGFVREQKRPGPEGRRDRIMFLTGIREHESQIRMGYQSTIIDRVGAQVWVNPIYRWDDYAMKQYREEHDLPRNPVAEHIHMSGECLCGCFARPGELAEIEFFFPQTAERIRSWERAAAQRGLAHCIWGARRPDEHDDPMASPMCRQCIGQMEMFEGADG